MQKGTKYALILGAIPFITLVFALPLVNRVEPVILGLPFLLFWIISWVMLTPLILFAAFLLEKKYNIPDDKKIGYDLKLDKKRFVLTASGIVIVAKKSSVLTS